MCDCDNEHKVLPLEPLLPGIVAIIVVLAAPGVVVAALWTPSSLLLLLLLLLLLMVVVAAAPRTPLDARVDLVGRSMIEKPLNDLDGDSMHPGIVWVGVGQRDRLVNG